MVQTKINLSKSKWIIQFFLEVAKNKKYWNLWRTSSWWVLVIKRTFKEAHALEINEGDLNRAFSRHQGLKLCFMHFNSHKNNMGIYADRYHTADARITAYYVTQPGTEVKKPPKQEKWWKDIVSRCSKRDISGTACPAEVISKRKVNQPTRIQQEGYKKILRFACAYEILMLMQALKT